MEAVDKAGAEILAKVRELVSENSGLQLSDAFGDSDDLFAAGLQSLHCVRVLLAIEDDFEIEIPQDKIDRELFSSIDNLAAAVVAEIGAS